MPFSAASLCACKSSCLAFSSVKVSGRTLITILGLNKGLCNVSVNISRTCDAISWLSALKSPYLPSTFPRDPNACFSAIKSGIESSMPKETLFRCWLTLTQTGAVFP